MNLEIPITIDLEKLFTERELNNEKKHIGKYEYFLHLIYSEQVFENQFVPISNIVLTKHIRQQIVSRMKSFLLNEGIIECDFKQQFKLVRGKPIGVKSFCYRIAKRFYVEHNLNLELLNERINANNSSINSKKLSSSNFSNNNIYKYTIYRTAFLKKIIKPQDKTWNTLMKQNNMKEYQFIKKNAFKLELDLNTYSWIDGKVKDGLKLKPKREEFIDSTGRRIVWNKKRILNMEIAENWKIQMKKIEHKLFKFSCPASVNRVYYNITFMPSELRKFLRFKGKPLVYLDFSNFQPFLLIKTLTEIYSTNLPDDVKRYIELTSKGTFYNEIKTLLKSKKIEIRREDEFKMEFFKNVFFSSEKRKNKYRTAFGEEFPNVAKAISKTKEKDYKNLSINLQKLESKLVINTILHELAETQPDSFVLPVHDALICEESMSDTVYDIMMKATTSLIGYSPKIKKEVLECKQSEKQLQIA